MVPPITVSIAKINPAKGTPVCCIGIVLVFLILFEAVSIVGVIIAGRLWVGIIFTCWLLNMH